MAATHFNSPEPELSPTAHDDQPMFGNPTLTRGHTRKRGRAWLIGVPLAIVALAVAGVAFFATSGRNQMADTTSTVVSEETPTQAAAPPVGPAVNPVTPPVNIAQASPPPAPAEKPAPAPKAAPTRRAAVTHHAVRRASSASESSADVSASVPASPPVISAPPPPMTTP